jgi:hypothetical protein
VVDALPVTVVGVRGFESVQPFQKDGEEVTSEEQAFWGLDESGMSNPAVSQDQF